MNEDETLELYEFAKRHALRFRAKSWSRIDRDERESAAGLAVAEFIAGSITDEDASPLPDPITEMSEVDFLIESRKWVARRIEALLKREQSYYRAVKTASKAIERSQSDSLHADPRSIESQVARNLGVRLPVEPEETVINRLENETSESDMKAMVNTPELVGLVLAAKAFCNALAERAKRVQPNESKPTCGEYIPREVQDTIQLHFERGHRAKEIAEITGHDYRICDKVCHRLRAKKDDAGKREARKAVEEWEANGRPSRLIPDLPPSSLDVRRAKQES